MRRGKGFKKKARDDIEGAARGRPILAKSRLIDALMGKPVPRPKLAEMATRAAIKAWVIDTTETRAANLAERARRAAEQAAAAEAAAATEAAETAAAATAAAAAVATATGRHPSNWDEMTRSQKRHWRHNHRA